MNKAMDSRHLYNANHGWKNAIFSIQDLWYRALHTSRWPCLIILQVITGRRFRSSGWGPLGRWDSTPEISRWVNKEGITVQAINLELPFDSPEFGCIFSHNHHFHFSTHSSSKPIFGSFLLSSLKAFVPSHWGETTSVYPQFGNRCTISDISFLFYQV